MNSDFTPIDSMFQSALLREERYEINFQAVEADLFQSALLREERWQETSVT